MLLVVTANYSASSSRKNQSYKLYMSTYIDSQYIIVFFIIFLLYHAPSVKLALCNICVVTSSNIGPCNLSSFCVQNIISNHYNSISHELWWGFV